MDNLALLVAISLLLREFRLWIIVWMRATNRD